MIYDKIENLDKYVNLHPRFTKAFSYLKQLIAGNADIGRHDMPNCDVPNAVFANVNSYNTSLLSDQAQIEIHHKYIDIQIMMSGEESIYVPTTNLLISTRTYDDMGDYELVQAPAEDENVRLVMRPNMFAIFFPNEPHLPGIAHGESVSVHKIIGKVLD